jgi:hypothetical protein
VSQDMQLPLRHSSTLSWAATAQSISRQTAAQYSNSMLPLAGTFGQALHAMRVHNVGAMSCEAVGGAAADTSVAHRGRCSGQTRCQARRRCIDCLQAGRDAQPHNAAYGQLGSGLWCLRKAPMITMLQQHGFCQKRHFISAASTAFAACAGHGDSQLAAGIMLESHVMCSCVSLAHVSDLLHNTQCNSLTCSALQEVIFCQVCVAGPVATVVPLADEGGLQRACTSSSGSSISACSGPFRSHVASTTACHTVHCSTSVAVPVTNILMMLCPVVVWQKTATMMWHAHQL